MRLIFVYNADSGKINSILDGIHKIVSPDTYDCNLCAITFGNFSENKTWKKFRETSDIEMQFYHKDEFLSQFRSKWLKAYEFPIILYDKKGELEQFISTTELNKLETAEDLILEISNRTTDH